MEYLDAKAEVQARMDAGETHEDGSELVLPTATTLLMGITKASLATDSFLSAASFQELSLIHILFSSGRSSSTPRDRKRPGLSSGWR